VAIRLGQSTFFSEDFSDRKDAANGLHADTFGEPSRAELATALTGANFCRTAVRNLERAGVPRSAMVGHLTMSIYSRYAIADEFMLKDSRKIEPAT
jgi:hypothetical protein